MMRILGDVQFEHRHGDDWHEMRPAEVGHGEGAPDPERHWDHGRIFRCADCDDEFRVKEPSGPRG